LEGEGEGEYVDVWERVWERTGSGTKYCTDVLRTVTVTVTENFVTSGVRPALNGTGPTPPSGLRIYNVHKRLVQMPLLSFSARFAGTVEVLKIELPQLVLSCLGGCSRMLPTHEEKHLVQPLTSTIHLGTSVPSDSRTVLYHPAS
jgi:hypothetical protein